MKGALALYIGLDEIEAGQLVFEALHQLGVNPFLLPLGQHGVAYGVGAEGRHIVHGQLGVGTSQVDRRVEGVSAEVAHYARLALG
ncbi:hypothetical protein D3C80_1673470 [compost metagenome]